MENGEEARDESGNTMEEVDHDDAKDPLTCADDEHEDAKTEQDAEETAQELMEDMKLADEVEDIKSLEPDFDWTYFIEVYPWNSEDMTENFVKLIRLAQFSRVVMKKTNVSNESEDKEKGFQLTARQRKGCLQFFLEDGGSAKLVMRNMTWKSMAAKELTVEVTRRDIETGHTETATLDVNSYLLCKIKFREKQRGELKDRSAKVSNLPGDLTRGFLELILNRAHPVIKGETQKVHDSVPSQKLQEIEDFDGTLDFDCLTRGSCRAFVSAHKQIVINGHKLGLVANDPQTMVIPPFTHDIGVKKKPVEVTVSNSKSTPGLLKLNTQAQRGRGNFTAGRGLGPGMSSPRMPSRGSGRGIIQPLRPLSAPFLTRPSSGVPVPMTGRQKMNEKMRRNNVGTSAYSGALGGMQFAMPQGNMMRGSMPGSVGDSFKHDITSLQKQLADSTKAIEAKIAMLQQNQRQSQAYYDTEMMGYDASGWDQEEFGYDDYGNNEDYTEDDMYTMMPGQDFSEQASVMQRNVFGRGMRPLQATTVKTTISRGMSNRMVMPSTMGSGGREAQRGSARGRPPRRGYQSMPF